MLIRLHHPSNMIHCGGDCYPIKNMLGAQSMHGGYAQGACRVCTVTEGLRMVARCMEGAHGVVAKCAEGMWRLQR